MNTYLENDYLKIEDQISNHKELIITKHFSKRMIERAIRYQDLKNCLLNPRVIRHEGSYDSYGKLKIKYTYRAKIDFRRIWHWYVHYTKKVL